MPSRVRREGRRSKWVVLILSAFLFVVGWWAEPSWLDQPSRQRSAGAIAPGEYRVLRVVDGDTIILEKDRTRARLQGIDTPETVKPNSPVEPWGPEASEYTKRFIADADNRVRLEIDGETIDRYGRQLVFVWHEGRLLNEELVRNGLARAKLTFDFSQSMKGRLRQAQEDARVRRLGIWSK